MIQNIHQNLLRFDSSKITIIQWPAQSFDLNPIENLRKQLGDKVCLHGRFRNAEGLYQELPPAWSQIKQVQIDKLFEPIPHTDVPGLLRTIDMPLITDVICF